MVPAIAPGTAVDVAEQDVRDAGLTPERTRAFVGAEIEKWLPIVRATGATIH